METYSYRKILLIAAPLMVGTFVQSIVTFTDAIFVSQLGQINIGAFGNGSLFYLAVLMFCRGLADGTQIIIARLNGEQNIKAIGTTFLNAQSFQLILSTIVFFLIQIFSSKITIEISDSTEIASAMNDFLSVRAFGLFFAAQHLALVAFFMGLGRTNIILYSALLIAACNIVLDAVFINGLGFIPAYGLKGAPLASTISEAIGFAYLFYHLYANKAFSKYNYRLNLGRIQLKKHYNLIKLSLPLMLQGVVSLSTWLVFFTLIEHMGKSALESAQNIRYMYFLAFVPIYGFGATTKTVVSTLIGRGNQLQIPHIQKRLILLTIGFMFIVFHGALFYPETLIQLIDRNPTITPEVLADSSFILQFVFGSIIIFAITVVYFNSISGIGKTQITFLIEVIAIIAYLVGCHLFFNEWHWNIREVWWVEYIYFTSMGICSFVYFRFYHKKHHLNES